MASLLVMLAGCDLFDVENPQQIEAEKLRDPLFMEPLVIGAEARLATALGAHQLMSALVSDELVNIGPDPEQASVDRGHLTPENGDWSYSNGVAAIFSADDAAMRISALLERTALASGDRVKLEALIPRALLAAGFSRLYMAMYFQHTTVRSGPAKTPQQTLEAAAESFTSAIEAARTATDRTVEVRALAGRARAYLFLGDVEGAAADARAALALDPRFVHRLEHNNYDFRTIHAYVRSFRWMAADANYAVPPVRVDSADQIPPGGDPRVVLSADSSPLKYFTLEQGMVVAKWQEMHLIVAEDAWRAGRLDEAVEHINAVRTQGQAYLLVDGGLQLTGIHMAPFVVDASAGSAAAPDQVRDQIIYERAAESWLEGLRWPDARRFLDSPFDHPAALAWPPATWTGVTDLRQTFPIGITELRQNPNL